MLDVYWHGSTSRISPEAPVPVVLLESQEARVGGAGNVAVNVASMGAQARLVALTGDDGDSERLGTLLAAHKVHCTLRRIPGSKTIAKTRVLSRHQQILRMDVEDSFTSASSGIALHDFAEAVDGSHAVVFSDYGKGALRDVERLLAHSRQLRLPVVVDPKGVHFDRYRGATVLTPNQSEFEAVVGRCPEESTLVQRGAELCRRLNLGALLVTRGERGMTLVTESNTVVHLPAQAREVFDVTGAGDTVAAFIGLGLAAGVPLVESVRLSNIAAGIVVGKLGTASVTPEELASTLPESPSVQGRGKVCTPEILLRLRETARARGHRVVMTNGCFDILHPGHIDYLERARELGDRLVIAVNDDDSVRRLKGGSAGSSRPINALPYRLRMLSALACVDWIVAFSEDTPEQLISRVLPDVLVKGGDYRPESIAGGKQVAAAGGTVLTIPLVPGYSTTALIEHIRREDAP